MPRDSVCLLYTSGTIVKTVAEAKTDGKGYNKSKTNGNSVDSYVVHVKITEGTSTTNPKVETKWVN